jgi:hypothetical protein
MRLTPGAAHTAASMQIWLEGVMQQAHGLYVACTTGVLKQHLLQNNRVWGFCNSWKQLCELAFSNSTASASIIGFWQEIISVEMLL